MKIYHNPRCSTSRKALKMIEDHGIKPEIIKYLDDVPTEAEFKKVLVKLNLKATDVLRKREQIYKEHYAGKNFTEEEWITIMLENPKLIERPIIVKDNAAVIARPMQNLEDLLNK
ncbi:MAG: arsenate reductase [Patiriisocius sp.]|jgi:arsenate reductase